MQHQILLNCGVQSTWFLIGTIWGSLLYCQIAGRGGAALRGIGSHWSRRASPQLLLTIKSLSSSLPPTSLRNCELHLCADTPVGKLRKLGQPTLWWLPTAATHSYQGHCSACIPHTDALDTL